MPLATPLGVRPLCIGRLNGGWVVASESCALDTVGATYIREVEPGELIVIDSNGLRSIQAIDASRQGASASSSSSTSPARTARSTGGWFTRSGRRWAGPWPGSTPWMRTWLSPCPTLRSAASTGFADETGIPFGEGLIKNRYIGRTFIQPDQRLRDVGVQLKFNPMPEVLRGKRIVVVDDSIVRGTTTPAIVAMLRKAGAREVHMRMSAPPMTRPMLPRRGHGQAVGVDSREHERGADPEHIGADTLGYLSLNGLLARSAPIPPTSAGHASPATTLCPCS